MSKQVSDSEPAKLKPTPPPSRRAARTGHLGVLIAVSMIMAGWMFATSILPRPAPAANVQVAPMPDVCADAVERVKAYQAPGQRAPLSDVLAASVAAAGEHRPVAVVGWEPPHVWRGNCEVGLQLSMGNEITTLRWAVRTDTGRVDAMNGLTKQMSGW